MYVVISVIIGIQINFSVTSSVVEKIKFLITKAFRKLRLCTFNENTSVFQ